MITQTQTDRHTHIDTHTHSLSLTHTHTHTLTHRFTRTCAVDTTITVLEQVYMYVPRYLCAKIPIHTCMHIYV